MFAYALRRLLILPFILLGVSAVLFFLSHMVSGDPAKILAGEKAPAATVELIRQQFGLDKPLPEQYRLYLVNLLHGNMGISLTTRRPVLEDLRLYFPATLELTALAILLTILIGVPLGIVSAARRNSAVDHASRLITLSGVSLPVFWLGLLLQLLFYRYLNILPIAGRLSLSATPPPQITGLYTIDSLLAGDFATFWMAAGHLILPAVTLAFSSLAVVSRMTRSNMLEVLSQDYIRTARSKGLGAQVVLYQHALRNAFIPTVTVIGLQTGALLSGAFLVEAIFDWPGLGLYTVRAISRLDYPAIMGASLLITVVFILINLLVDVLYGVLDPRIRY